MSNTQLVKTNFSAGEIAPELMGRSDLKLYQNGAKTLENVFVQPTGGVTRRHGLRYVDTLPAGDGRLIPFEKNNDVYLLIVTDGTITIFKDDIYLTDIAAPWTIDQVRQIAWVQSNDELLLVHPDVQPRKLSFNGTTWTLSTWTFLNDAVGRVFQPYHNFNQDITITPSGTAGTITLTAVGGNLFTAGHVGVHFLIHNKAVQITAVASGTSATATVIETLIGVGTSKEWKEAAFSPVRGWPRTVAFHQGRLVIGGSRDLPNRLFMSKSGLLWMFDLGEGLDDESIEFSILSDQQNDIQGLFSSRHLLIFTSGGEWLATGSPLTPGTLQLQRQGRIGSRADYFVPLQDVDGATYFIARDGRQVREMYYSDVEGAYTSTDLAVTARHMVEDAIDQSYDPKNRQLHVVLADGTMSTLTIYRTEGINAWSRQITDGAFKAVSAIGTSVYVIVERDEGFFVERFDENTYLDSARTYTSVSPTDDWTAGFSHIPDRTITVILDGIIRGEAELDDGDLITDEEGLEVQGGIGYTSKIVPLPPSQLNFASAHALRLIELKLRLFETSALTLDTGGGPRNIPLQGSALPEPQTYLPRVTKDVSVRAYGWTNDLMTPLWTIEQDTPQPFTLLSVTASMKVSS